MLPSASTLPCPQDDNDSETEHLTTEKLEQLKKINITTTNFKNETARTD